MAARKTNSSTRRTAPSKKTTPKESKPPKAKRVLSDEPYAFHEVLALVLAGISAMFVLALISYSPADLPSWVPFSSQSGRNGVVGNFIGPVGAVVAGYAYFFFGAACFLIPAVLAWWSIQVLTGTRPFHARNLFSFAFLVCSAACLIEFQVWFFQDWAGRYNLPKSAGGFFGYGVGHKLVEQFLGSVGSVIVVSIIYLIALIVITGIHPFQFLAMLRKGIVGLFVSLRERGVTDAYLYGAAEASDVNAIEAIVARLRRKFGADVIVTRRGFGYLPGPPP